MRDLGSHQGQKANQYDSCTALAITDYASFVMEQQASMKVFSNNDICRMIKELCNMPAMVNLGNTCKTCRPMCDSVSEARFARISKRFFGERAREFRNVLHQHRGVITGSAAQVALLGEFDTPRDLNLIVPHGHFAGMQHWLIKCRYEALVESGLQEDLSKFVLTFDTYHCQDEAITLSEATGPDVLELVVNAPSTADMTFMTAGGVVSLYPELTLSWKGLIAPSGKWELMLGGRFGSINAGRFELHKNTSFYDKPCGTSCPTMWRLPRTDKSVLVVDWDKRYSVQPSMHQCKTEWKLFQTCDNKHCPSNLMARRDGPTFEQEYMPDSQFDVQDRLRDIGIHQPAFKAGYKGLLYATRCSKPMIVDVPLIEGANQYKNIEDLYVECWVSQRGLCDTSTRRAKLRRTYYSVPKLDTVPLDFAYTIFSEEGESDPPINALVSGMTPPRPNGASVQGNFLVMKQELKSKDLLDICDDDRSVVNLLLRSAIIHEAMPPTHQRKAI
ncbi:hypothetical protein BJ138DRAFT_1116224 [Hygrophoropsis aurantiaca]|uniref:Uncharacterized protein n=1 Tax=Hygrophoropsis aurantiaca TaxID=72124 RepID=A0ACB8A4N2_9AGAM|nr:hypothetical protein BJ138DRAFT_1116224 [Hygrophoropsis aurantiaca]